MGKFKRFCMIVFVVAAVLGIGVLAALWFAWEPLFPAIAWLMSMPWFFVVEAVLLGITALGLLVVLIRAITAPGKNSQLELERDNGSIAITQNAIQSTVKHVVESPSRPVHGQRQGSHHEQARPAHEHPREDRSGSKRRAGTAGREAAGRDRRDA